MWPFKEQLSSITVLEKKKNKSPKIPVPGVNCSQHFGKFYSIFSIYFECVCVCVCV